MGCGDTGPGVGALGLAGGPFLRRAEGVRKPAKTAASGHAAELVHPHTWLPHMTLRTQAGTQQATCDYFF